MNTPVDIVLARLPSARRTGRGWIAKCPAHNDRSPSLSIGTGDDGRALVRCFGGCDIGDVLAALDLSLTDLFERRIASATTVAERSELHEQMRQAAWRAALGVLGCEASVVAVAAGMIQRDEAFSNDDHDRLVLAIQRIQCAREVLAP